MRRVQLGEVCDFSYGDSLKEEVRRPGKIPVFGSNGIVGWHDQATTSGPTIVIGRKGSIGEINWSAEPCFPIDTTYFVEKTKKPCDLRWLYFTLLKLDLTRLNKSAAVPGLNRDDAYEQKIPFPDLPEQKRIAGLLEQADRLRRTRRYALELSATFLPAAFLQLFGDLHVNKSKFKFEKLENHAAIASGIAKGQKYGDKKTVTVPYLRVANVQDGHLNLSEIKTIQALPGDVEALRLKPGDIVMTEGGDFDKLGRGAVWPGGIPDCIHQNHIFRVRLDQKALLPVFFAAFLRSSFAKNYFLRCSKQTTNLASINMTQLRATPVPLPPLAQQHHFAALVAQHERLRANQREALRQADHLFHSLLHRAFGGGL